MKKCDECGGTKKVRYYQSRTYLCSRHYQQIWKHGRILLHTKYTPNEFVEKDDHVEIVIRKETIGEEIGRALIDKRDFKRVRQHKWHLAKRESRVYVATAIKKRPELLHTFLLGRKDGLVIDHIDGNGLNCKRSNLRHVTNSVNLLNQTKRISQSGRMGVFWRPEYSCWVANIVVERRKISRHCKSFEEAVAKREEMEREYLGITYSELQQSTVQ